MINVTYIPNKFEDTRVVSEFPFDVENPELLPHIATFVDLNEKYSYTLCKERITVYVNDKEIEVTDWNNYKIKDEDRITITPTIEGGKGGLLNVIVGAILVVVGYALTATGLGAIAGVPVAYIGVGIMVETFLLQHKRTALRPS